jgi:hypothetical protein
MYMRRFVADKSHRPSKRSGNSRRWLFLCELLGRLSTRFLGRATMMFPVMNRLKLNAAKERAMKSQRDEARGSSRGMPHRPPIER